MRLSDFDYKLPSGLIAQTPASPRDHSRLLVLNRANQKIEDKNFYNLAGYLKKGDVLVLNNTKVMPARLIGKKVLTGGKIEVFLLKKNLPQPSFSVKLRADASKRGETKKEEWQCLVGGPVKTLGLEVEFDKKLIAKIIKDNQDGTWQVEFNQAGKKLTKTINEIGLIPLPPYIKKLSKGDKQRYQTVFALDKKVGSAAAPTAGLHFTDKLIRDLKKIGVQFEYVTLHVGLGTFASVKTDDIKEHKMHSEWAEIDKKTLSKLREAKKENRRIIAVGTTSIRTLESAWQEKNLEYFSWTSIFIYPGYKFKVVDAMITNFHVPKSTLLMLVSAFVGENYKDKKVGVEIIKKVYKHAIEKKYSFLSYGDAMLID